MRNTVPFAAVVAAGFAMHLSTAQATSESVVYSFCSQANCADGDAPAASLIDMNGILYGTTQEGGTGRYGTVFSIDPNTGVETVLHSFTNKPDGAGPVAPLMNVGGVLYGTTSGGGAEYLGTVFSIDPSTGVEIVLHSFGGTKDGAGPKAGLIAVKDKLYGTTEEGGTGACRSPGCGTVFAINLKTGRETVVYSFCSQTNCPDGAVPDAGLIDVNGILYGTTTEGGVDAPRGVVFSLDPSTGKETVLYSFCSQGNCADGADPEVGLTEVKGMLYGTTAAGGARQGGIAFALDPATGVETVLHSFCAEMINRRCVDGDFPFSTLLDGTGTLYGTTWYGGRPGERFGNGTVFSLDRKTGRWTKLYSFKNIPDGAYPGGNLINLNGTLYGTTAIGGSNGSGTVFSIQQ